jgi:hypothetical protein
MVAQKGLGKEGIFAEVSADVLSDISDRYSDDSLQNSDSDDVKICSVILHESLCFERYHCQKHYYTVFW